MQKQNDLQGDVISILLFVVACAVTIKSENVVNARVDDGVELVYLAAEAHESIVIDEFGEPSGDVIVDFICVFWLSMNCGQQSAPVNRKLLRIPSQIVLENSNVEQVTHRKNHSSCIGHSFYYYMNLFCCRSAQNMPKSNGGHRRLRKYMCGE